MKYVLAPLADFTDAPFRLMCFRGGADAAYTEMVSAAALFHAHDATRRLLETREITIIVCVYLFKVREREYFKIISLRFNHPQASLRMLYSTLPDW